MPFDPTLMLSEAERAAFKVSADTMTRAAVTGLTEAVMPAVTAQAMRMAELIMTEVAYPFRQSLRQIVAGIDAQALTALSPRLFETRNP